MSRFKHPRFLIPIGLFVMSGALIVFRYFQLPDFIVGVIFGVGLGTIILGVRQATMKSVSR